MSSRARQRGRYRVPPGPRVVAPPAPGSWLPIPWLGRSIARSPRFRQLVSTTGGAAPLLPGCPRLRGGPTARHPAHSAPRPGRRPSRRRRRSRTAPCPAKNRSPAASVRASRCGMPTFSTARTPSILPAGATQETVGPPEKGAPSRRPQRSASCTIRSGSSFSQCSCPSRRTRAARPSGITGGPPAESTGSTARFLPSAAPPKVCQRLAPRVRRNAASRVRRTPSADGSTTHTKSAVTDDELLRVPRSSPRGENGPSFQSLLGFRV